MGLKMTLPLSNPIIKPQQKRVMKGAICNKKSECRWKDVCDQSILIWKKYRRA